ncbi:nucleotidyltransferase family protein [Seohaeicola nanhaiensis]|uniref:Nucleotidyltransferase family protein n=1 Tax=Seohaeicola nanhaiensis TaxID=1387282 RepID=A0ABV9KGN5_9RHOB
MTLPVLLFAAGFGTRMGALTRDRPKPLIAVAGRPLIDHALDLAVGIGAPVIAANAHYKAEMLAAHLTPKGVEISHETPDILDTGGGLKAALPLLGDGPVITLNTDAIWSGPNPLAQLLAAWDPARMDALLTCVPHARTVGRDKGGDFGLDAEGRISRGGDMVYGGAQIIAAEHVAAHPGQVFSMNAVWDEMAERGRLFGAIYPGRWCDVGHPDGIRIAETLLSEPHV